MEDTKTPFTAVPTACQELDATSTTTTNPTAASPETPHASIPKIALSWYWRPLLLTAPFAFAVNYFLSYRYDEAVMSQHTADTMQLAIIVIGALLALYVAYALCGSTIDIINTHFHETDESPHALCATMKRYGPVKSGLVLAVGMSVALGLIGLFAEATGLSVMQLAMAVWMLNFLLMALKACLGMRSSGQ